MNMLDEFKKQEEKFIENWKEKIEHLSYHELLELLTTQSRCHVIFRVSKLADIFWYALREAHDEYKKLA